LPFIQKMTAILKSTEAVRVLLVDDNRHGLAARKGVLEQEGYTVVACGSSTTALHELRSSRFDLLITDFRMPEMNGIELISRLRTFNRDLPVILVSGIADVLGLDEQNTGADIVISKSATEVPHLLRAAARLLSRSTPRKPAGAQSAARAARSRSL
jgi:CheY-like chemotaxis protein